MQAITFHPLANIFPLMDGEDFDALTTDIRDHGLREPIVLFEGQILDGRNRYRACAAAGVDARLETFRDGDAVAYVVSKNLRRRHLDESQRAMVAAKLANLRPGRPSNKTGAPLLGQTVENSTVSQSQAAEMLNVSRETVISAAKVQREAASPVIKAVERGEVSVSAAAKAIKAVPDKATQENWSVADIKRAARQEIREAVPLPDLPTPAKAKQLAKEQGGAVLASDGKYHGYVAPDVQAEWDACGGAYDNILGLAGRADLDPARVARLIKAERAFQSRNVDQAIAWMDRFKESWNG